MSYCVYDPDSRLLIQNELRCEFRGWLFSQVSNLQPFGYAEWILVASSLVIAGLFRIQIAGTASGFRVASNRANIVCQ